MNCVLRNVKSLGLHSETLSCITPTNLTVTDVLSSLKLNYTLTLLLFSLVILFTAKGIYLNHVYSGFEPESQFRFRTWTWKVGNTFSSISHSSLPFIFFFFGERRHRQRFNDLTCTSFCNRISFCCHVFTYNNLENFNNQITAIFKPFSTLN